MIHDADDTERSTAQFFESGATRGYFSVHWDKDNFGDDVYPSVENDCGNGEKFISHEEEKCLCTAEALDRAIFSSLPTRDQVLSDLQLGAFAPEMFDIIEYELVDNSSDV